MEVVKSSGGRFTAALMDGTALMKETPAGVVGPSYISATQFRTALVDILCNRFGLSINPEFAGQLRDRLLADAKMNGTPFADILVAFTRAAGDDAEAFFSRLEKWFDESMERVGGWYTRRTQRRLFLIGLAIAVGGNVDALRMGKALYRNPILREKAAAAASRLAGQLEAAPKDSFPDADSAIQYYLKVQRELDNLNVPMGWGFGRGHRSTVREQMQEAWFFFLGPSENVWKTLLGLLGKVMGWLIAALAVAMGAPFWFDLLKRFIRIRSAGGAPRSEGVPAEAPAK